MVLISLGSNQGDSQSLLTSAIERLRSRSGGDFRASRLYVTSPVDCPPGSPPFVNACVAFHPQRGESPESLLQWLKTIEREFGRQQAIVRNAPRRLDLDLILFGMECRASLDFELPHPRAVQRRFVLQPAADVAAQQRWPHSEQTIAELLGALDSSETVRPI